MKKLKKEQSIALSKACLDNAEYLLASSKLLFENKKYNHSLFFIICALEEFSKVWILCFCEMAKNLSDTEFQEKLWRSLTNHKSKYNFIENYINH